MKGKSHSKAQRRSLLSLWKERPYPLGCGKAIPPMGLPVAIDAHGWPYPIAKDEFEKIYMAVGYKEKGK